MSQAHIDSWTTPPSCPFYTPSLQPHPSSGSGQTLRIPSETPLSHLTFNLPHRSTLNISRTHHFSTPSPPSGPGHSSSSHREYGSILVGLPLHPWVSLQLPACTVTRVGMPQPKSVPPSSPAGATHLVHPAPQLHLPDLPPLLASSPDLVFLLKFLSAWTLFSQILMGLSALKWHFLLGAPCDLFTNGSVSAFPPPFLDYSSPDTYHLLTLYVISASHAVVSRTSALRFGSVLHPQHLQNQQILELKTVFVCQNPHYYTQL